MSHHCVVMQSFQNFLLQLHVFWYHFPSILYPHAIVYVDFIFVLPFFHLERVLFLHPLYSVFQLVKLEGPTEQMAWQHGDVLVVL